MGLGVIGQGKRRVRRTDGRLYASPKTYVPPADAKKRPASRPRGPSRGTTRPNGRGAAAVRAVSVREALEVRGDRPVQAVEDGGGGGVVRIGPDDDGADVAGGGRAGPVEGDGHDLRIEGAQRLDAGEPESERLAR